jgi:hypothetical protein
MTLYKMVHNTQTGEDTRVLMSDDEEAARITESDTNAIASKREALLNMFSAEGFDRILAQVPEWDSEGNIKPLNGVWAALDQAEITPKMALARSIYLYVKTSVPSKLSGVADADLDSVDSAASDPFGDGTTAWPT